MSFAEDDFGKKIDLPAWNSLTLGASQQGAIADNQAALPGAAELASQTNLLNQQELDKILENQMPGYGAAKGKISGNILDLAQGKIPKDISDLVMRNSAVRSLYGGFGGSGASRNLVARDLGLTSLDLTGKGLDAMSRWLQTTTPKQFDITSMFVTPTQRFAADTQERDAKFQYDYLQAQIDAMPDPATRGIMDAVRAAGIAYLGGNYQTGTNYTSPGGGGTGGGGGTNFYRGSDAGYFPDGSSAGDVSAQNSYGGGYFDDSKISTPTTDQFSGGAGGMMGMGGGFGGY